jgi:hypothetical protein
MKKDIKEAIKEHLYANTFVTDSNNPGFVDRFFEHTKAAEWGANWRINSAWHDASERPDKGKMLIVEDIDSAYDLVYLTQSKPWEELSEKNHYMCWAYIEDLLPNMEN